MTLSNASNASNDPNDPAPAWPALQHRYASELPELCIAWRPARVPQPAQQVFNHALAHELGWSAAGLDGPQGAQWLSGNAVPDAVRTVAQAYAGHQFGGYSPQLGDGRALLLGEVVDAQGHLRDVAFKGSGRTPFSRGGDGKAALGPMLREYLISEAMHALGVPTTRSLAVVTTGERIRRDSGAVPAAVLTRVAASHIRVGTFQWVAARGDLGLLRRLADHTLARHFPDVAPGAYPDLLAAGCQRQAALVAQWMGLGFVHGVMNTDNMALSGETIDYGPCAFMETFDPNTVFSSIDHGGRYAWGHQPGIAQWNLTRWAETLLPLLHADPDEAVALATEILNQFATMYPREWLAVMRAKLGLLPRPDDPACDAEDQALISAWLAHLQAQGTDWTLAHRHLCDLVQTMSLELAAQPPQPTPSAQLWPTQLFTDPTGLNAWCLRWQARLRRNPSGQPPDWASAMRRANPMYIPRNQRVEEALSAATHDGNLAPFHALLAVVQRPFDDLPGQHPYAQPATPSQAAGYRTFCGT